jgi:glycosyltransferase involved in cell wall biosynthesis
MTILIDGMNLALEQGTGVATYARNLSYCLRRLGRRTLALYGRRMPAYRDPVLREAAFLDSREERARSVPRFVADLVRSIAAERPAVVPETGLVLREQLRGRLPAADGFLNLDGLFLKAHAKFVWRLGMLEIDPPEPVSVAHWTFPLPIRVRGAKNIYTVHDMVPLKLPYATLDIKSRYYRLMRMIARSADRIVTVSEASRRDILSMLPIAEDKVVNTYQSVAIPPELLEPQANDLAAELQSVAEVRRADGTFERLFEAREFFLFVGAIEPKKNLKRLIEGFLAAGVQQPLVVVGRRAWQYEEVEAMMKRSPRVVYLDYLPFSQLVTLMRSARALVFPSLYEGFGLPVLEAFLCGTPVITADASSTAEIAGEAALLVDPYDVRSIRDAIRALAAPDSGPRRAELAERGRRRAEEFGEARIAARLDALYRDLAA